MKNNPLLATSSLPKFSSIEESHILPALQHVLSECRIQIAELCEITTPNWQNFALIMENLDENISRVWSPISHLNGVKDSAGLRDVYQQGIALLTEYHSEVGQNTQLYDQYKIIKQHSSFSELSRAQKKVIDNTLLDFRLSGAELNNADKTKFAELNLQLADLSNQFERNLLDSTQAWSLLIDDKNKLKGMPTSALKLAEQFAKQNEQTGWLLNLQFPSYLPVMQHVENADLREQVYKAYSKRASEFSNNGNYDNSPLIDKILQCRRQQAQLLGYDNYAELSIEKKMAKSSAAVVTFLNDLVRYAKPVAQQELEQLQQFAKDQYQVTELNAWDISFYSERLREQQYAFNDEEVKPFFPVEQVFGGMFEIVKRLFNISVKVTTTMETWHDDVLCYDVYQEDSNTLIGQLYADIYVRKNKRSGAWMDTCIHRRRINDTVQNPVAFLTCNFSPPVESTPALLTHGEVETLFHEFGHTLHHLLTQVDEMSVAGINGVAWDAVELPSQFLENWCWQEQSLQLIAKHYETNKSIPIELLEKMRAAKNFQSGMQTLRQVEFALFDMQLHTNYEPENSDTSVQSLLDNVRQQVAVTIPPSYNRFQNSFGHIFSGGYAAGYYSYKWAEVLSADAFSRFEEEGIFNPNTGDDFMRTILQNGGEVEANQLFINFRGREPDIQSLLRHTGILQ